MKKQIQIKIAIAFLGALALSGCDLGDESLKSSLRDFFPLAQIGHPRADILEIKPHIMVTSKFVREVFGEMINEYQEELRSLPDAGYTTLMVSVDTGMCTWQVNDPLITCSVSSTGQKESYSLSGGRRKDN